MNNIDDKLWEHLVEHHGADRAQVPTQDTLPRTRRRPVMVGMAATGLAAIGVAAVLATGSGSPAAGPGGGGSSLSPVTGPVKAQDTAYIVKRVKAKVADDGLGSGVIRLEVYASGDVGSDGSLTNRGSQVGTGEKWSYFTADGSYYERVSDPMGAEYRSYVQMRNGESHNTVTQVNNVKHTYTQTESDYATPGLTKSPSTPTITSSPARLQQVLQSGQVTQLGTTTVNGMQAIALSTTNPSNGFNTILYVDSATYQPLRLINDATHSQSPAIKHELAVFDWLPATPENIAKAKDVSIPAGYTKVTPGGVGNRTR